MHSSVDGGWKSCWSVSQVTFCLLAAGVAFLFGGSVGTGGQGRRGFMYATGATTGAGAGASTAGSSAVMTDAPPYTDARDGSHNEPLSSRPRGSRLSSHESQPPPSTSRPALTDGGFRSRFCATGRFSPACAETLRKACTGRCVRGACTDLARRPGGAPGRFTLRWTGLTPSIRRRDALRRGASIALGRPQSTMLLVLGL